MDKPVLKGLLLWCGIFAISTAAHILGGGWLKDNTPLDTYGEAGRVALSLATTGTFSDPWPALPTGPTAHVAPAYPYLFGALIGLFGVGHRGWWAIHLLTLAMFAGQWALLPWVARNWGLPGAIGIVAAAIGAVLPIPGSCFKWEAICVGLLLVVLAGMTGLLAAAKPPATRLWFLAAILWGFGMLFSPVLFLPWLGWSALALYLSKPKTRRPLVLVLFIPLLIITPWTIRNYRLFHHFVPIRDNLGQELHFSNNDCASGYLRVNLRSGCLANARPYDSPEAAQRLLMEGEYQFNVDYLHDGIDWIRRHPGRFVKLTLARTRFFWFPPGEPDEGRFAALNIAMISGLTLLSLPGLYFIYRKQPWAACMLCGGMLLYSPIYYLSQVDLRYRYPIVWMTVFCVGGFLYEINQRYFTSSPKGVRRD